MFDAKIKVSLPKPYNGDRDATILETWLWDLKHYFGQVPQMIDSKKVNVVVGLLEGSTKLQ